MNMKKQNLIWRSLPLLAGLLLPTGLRAEEVGDEIVYQRWHVNKVSGERENVCQKITFTVTSADPSNRTVALYKRKTGMPYDPEKVFEDERSTRSYAPAMEYSDDPIWGSHPDHPAYPDEPVDMIEIPSTVKGEDGYTYTVTGIGSGSLRYYSGGSEKLVLPSTITEIGRYAIYSDVATLYSCTLTIPASVKRLHGNFVYGYGIREIVFLRTDGNFQLDPGTDRNYSLARGYVCTRATVPQAVIDQCKAGTRTDAFQEWYNECPSSIDPSQPLQAGCEFRVGVDDYLMNFTIIEAPGGQLEAALFSPYNPNVPEGRTLEDVTNGNVGISQSAISYKKYVKNNITEKIPMSIPSSVKGPDGKTYTVTTIGRYGCMGGQEFDISTITFPSTLLYIGQNGAGCDAVTFDLSKATGLKTIGKEAFSTSENMEVLLLPEGLETIENSAFHNVGYRGEGISLQLPVSLKLIGESAFSGAKLKSVNFNSLTNLKRICQYAFSYVRFESDHLEFAEGLERLSGFNYVRNIKSVKLPESLKSIDDFAFYEAGLEEVTIPAGTDSVFWSAFAGCDDLKKVTVKGARYIGREAFSSCNALEEVNLSPVVTKIDYDGFYNSKSLSKLNLAELVNLTYIGDGAFMNCPLGGEFPALDNLEHLGRACFRKCGFTGTPYYPKNVEFWGDYLFAENDFTGEVVIPSRLLYTCYGMFDGCNGITKVIFEAPEMYQEQDYATKFEKCSGVTDVYFKSAWPAMYFDLDEFAGPEKTKLHLSQWYIDYRKIFAEDPGFSGDYLNWYRANPESFVPWDEAYLPKGFYLSGRIRGYLFHPDLSPWDLAENDAMWTLTVDDPEKHTLKVSGFGMPRTLSATKYLHSVVVVPDRVMLDNHVYTVTSIGESAFQGRQVIPDPVFPTCGPCAYQMTGLYLPSTIKDIEPIAVFGNYVLQWVKFYEAGTKPFPTYNGYIEPYYDKQLGNINVFTGDEPVMTPQTELASELETIGEMAFAYNPLLQMELPASLKEIQEKGLQSGFSSLIFYNEEPDKLTWTDSGQSLTSDMTILVKQALYDQCAKGQRTDLFQRYFDAGQVVLMTKNSGDVNGDGVIDEKDVDELALAILETPSFRYVSYAADVDGNGKINMVDIVMLVNKIKSLIK